MAMLFLLALSLIVWQALRTKPLAQPSLEIATEKGEQILPVAVASWLPAPDLPPDATSRLAFLAERSLLWPDQPAAGEAAPGCQLFLRLSAHHWVRRSASRVQIAAWRGSTGAKAIEPQPRVLYFPVAAFLDDDDGDGDPLDAGELRPRAPGAEVEVDCGTASSSTDALP